MTLAMTAQEIAAFLLAEFPQVADEMVLDRLDDSALHLRLAVSGRHLRPGGTVSTMFQVVGRSLLRSPTSDRP